MSLTTTLTLADALGATGLRAEIAALRAELASYRALPLIPKPDHDRVVQQRDEYKQTAIRACDMYAETVTRAQRAEANADALARQLADERDRVPDAEIRARYARLLDLIAAELRHGDKEWHTPERRAVRDEMRAELVEAGR